VSERVSVLICTYNYARYLPQCLTSVLNQTRRPDEIIVLDDGSSDDTPDLMKKFPDVRYVYQENTGKAVAFGRAFSLSTGDIFCHLDADDYWEPGKLEKVLHCFERHPNLGGVLHEVRYVDGSGQSLNFPWMTQNPTEPQTLTLDGCADVSFLYPLPNARGRFFGVPNSSCIRRDALQDLLPLPREIGGSVDGILVAAALRYGMAYLPEALAAYRIHGNNAGFGNVASTQETISMWEFLLAHSNFRRFLSDRHAGLLCAKILERKAYLASRTGRHVLAGAWAGARVPWILAANGYRCSWKHLALPAACLLPIKRRQKKLPEPAIAPRPQPVNSAAELIRHATPASVTKSHASAPSEPRISVIIPTRNRCAVLTQCLNALPAGVRGLEPPEVIVVDDCSNDETGKVVSHFGDATGWPVHYLPQEHPRGANAARNAGLDVARGEIIVFLDDDALVSEGWLAKLSAKISQDVPVVSGPARLTTDGPLLGKHRAEVSAYLSEILVPARGSRGEIVPSACNMAAFRWVFDRARFDETVRPPVEENDWLERSGVRAGFVQDAWVWHHKSNAELTAHRIFAGMWRRGGEGGWWLRERLKIPRGDRWALARRSLHTSLRAFAHALRQGCRGGVAVGLGELSKALALIGLSNRKPRVPESWR
jgi:glycosyltransferase involved in cell wall biosynthesis